MPVITVVGGELFDERTHKANEDGNAWLHTGEYQLAIEKYKEAQIHHGKPSAVLENNIAFAYRLWGKYNLAIEHYTKALGISDDSMTRMGRLIVYHAIGRCDLAIPDAETVLTQKPETAPGLHTNVEALWVLSSCSAYNEEYGKALQYITRAIPLATEHDYSAEGIAIMVEWRDFLSDLQ